MLNNSVNINEDNKTGNFASTSKESISESSEQQYLSVSPKKNNKNLTFLPVFTTVKISSVKYDIQNTSSEQEQPPSSTLIQNKFDGSSSSQVPINSLTSSTLSSTFVLLSKKEKCRKIKKCSDTTLQKQYPCFNGMINDIRNRFPQYRSAF